MTLLIVIVSVAFLIILISALDVNPFLAFLLVSFIGGLILGVPLNSITKSVEKGIGDTLSSLLIILCLGAMLGKLIATSGAAQKIAEVMMSVFGVRYIQWAMVATGFIIGIPLFYGIGFVLMVPLIFSVTYRYKLPAVYIGLPMLAALSVTHGFLPPHPSPAALVMQFNANMGLTLLYGIAVAIPTIIIAGPIFAKTLKSIESVPLSTFIPAQIEHKYLPGSFNSFFTALLPVLILMGTTLSLHFVKVASVTLWISFLGEPSVVMLTALVFATFSLGVTRGVTIKQLMLTYTEAFKDIGMILLIIGGSGALKQVLTDSGASGHIANMLKHVSLPPLLLGWLIAAIIRACVGSATVAGLTTAGIILPLMLQTGTNPNLMVLAVGAGSLMFSHVNDSGFWMFKEYFNLTVKDTLRSWSAMETIVGLAGICGVLLLNLLIK